MEDLTIVKIIDHGAFDFQPQFTTEPTAPQADKPSASLVDEILVFKLPDNPSTALNPSSFQIISAGKGAVQDDGLLLPAVQTDNGLLLPY